METITDITVLDQLLVVNLDTHIWSASRKLLPEDLGNTELPPDELASLGSKKICNPEEMNIFKTLKARAESLLRQNGIRFLSGWAVPQEKMEDIDSSLAAIRDDFNTAKDNFLQRYENTVREWIDSHPAWSGIIANSIVSEDYVRSRLAFRWQVFRVMSPEISEHTRDDLVDDVINLGATLYEEIAKTATETWKNCYEGKTEVTRKALSPLKSMYEKLMGLTFVEPRVSSIASIISTALSSIPKRGPITGARLLMLQGLVSLLRNPQEIVKHGQKILDGQTSGDVLSALSGMETSTEIVEESLSESEPELPDVSELPAQPALESCGLW